MAGEATNEPPTREVVFEAEFSAIDPDLTRMARLSVTLSAAGREV